MSKECGSQGGLSTILVEPANSAFDVNSLRYDFIAEDLGLIETMPGGNGLAGRLDPNVEHVRDGPAYVRGRIMMHISPNELDFWLPYILRGTEAADVHIPADATDKQLDIMVKRDDATFVYTDLQVNSCMWRSNTAMGGDEPQLVEMMLDFVGVDEESGTYPVTPPPVPNTNKLFWLAADSVLVLNSVTYPYESFNLMHHNNLVVLMRNALRPQCIRSKYRQVRFQPRLPLSSDSAANLIFTKLDGGGSLTFDATANLSLASETIFTFDRLRGPRRSPRTRGRTETFHDLDLIAWAGVDPTVNPSISVKNTVI
jgi:hypothetical protein